MLSKITKELLKKKIFKQFLYNLKSYHINFSDLAALSGNNFLVKTYHSPGSTFLLPCIVSIHISTTVTRDAASAEI